MRRRAITLGAMVALATVVASGVALADNIAGGNGDNRLVGTAGKDVISGAGGNDDIYGKGDHDRLFGDDALQSGLGQDDLFGQRGSDFVNAIDGQDNDSVDCGRGANDVAGIDDLFQVGGSTDDVSEDCEILYTTIICGCIGAQGSGTGADLSNITSVKQAEQAVKDGLLKKVER